MITTKLKAPTSILTLYRSLLDTNSWLVFLFLCLALFLFSFVNTEFIATEELYEQHLASQYSTSTNGEYEALAEEYSEDLEKQQHEFMIGDVLLDVTLVVVQITIQLFFISSIVYVFCLVFTTLADIRFTRIFKVCMLSEFVFFIPRAIKYSWFLFSSDEYTYLDVKNFHPFSLSMLFSPGGDNPWLQIPLRFVNLFEVLYIILLVAGVSIALNTEWRKIGGPVTSAYLSLMMLWITIRVYLTTIL